MSYTALNASFFIQLDNHDEHHKKNHFVFYTARQPIYEYVTF